MDNQTTRHGPTEAPDGYWCANVPGRSLRHLVAIEAFNTTALCGVRVYNESLSSYWSGKMCQKCTKALASATGATTQGRG